MIAASPNWAEQLTGIGTIVSALGIFGALGAALFAGMQVREERRTRQAQMAADFFRRWNEAPLEETRELVNRFDGPDALRRAFEQYVATKAHEAMVLYREPDYFEQLAALESEGAIGLPLIEKMIGPALVERWELWRPSVEALHGPGTYPLFEALAAKLRPAGVERR